MLFVLPATTTSPEFDQDDDEDPGMFCAMVCLAGWLAADSWTTDVVQMMEADSDLGMTQRRDPDALPPSNAFETGMYWVHHALAALGHGNCVFAIKAGLLTGNVDVPALDGCIFFLFFILFLRRDADERRKWH